MSVVIVGGNECMYRRYSELCREYSCKAKIYPKMCNGLKNLGSPDLMILFTDTVSHKMVQCALNGIPNSTKVARCRSGSVSALKGVLEQHAIG